MIRGWRSHSPAINRSAVKFSRTSSPVDSPGVYVLQFQYRTADLPRESGLIWSAGPEQEFAISATGDWTERNWRFLTSNPAVRLVLAYRRARGTTRKEGKLFLRRVELKEDASL